MKAAQINKYGGSEVIEINPNAPEPVVSKGKILVEVRGAGLNPFDWKVREGKTRERAPLEFPATMGGDFSGVIEQLGEGVSGFTIGDEVYGTAGIFGGGSGSFAEKATADILHVAHKPKTISHNEAAALPIAGVSALQALTEHMNLTSGQKILIHGGVGGIGTFAIQLAKHLGAYVATTVNNDDFDYVKELGADEVIDYKVEQFENLLAEYDAVLDTVGGETYEKSFKVLKKGGVIVSMVGAYSKELAEKYGVQSIAQSTDISTAPLQKLTEFVDKGAIKVHIDKVFSLDQTREAFEHLQKEHPRGKVVIEIKK